MIYTTASSSPSTVTGGSSTIIIYSGIGGLGITNDTNAFSAGVVVFSGSNLTIGTSIDAGTQYIQMEAPALGGIAIGDGASNITNSTVVFGDLNGISFGLNGSTMTGSHNAYSNTTQFSTAFLTTAMASDAGSNFQYSSNTSIITADAVNTATLANLQYTSATSNITSNAVNTNQTSVWLTTAALSNHGHTQYAGTGTTITGGSVTLDSNGIALNIAANSLYYIDSNGITFGASSNGISTSITASYNSTQFLTTAAISNHTHSDLYVNTSISGSFQMTSNTSEITSLAFPSSDTTKFAGPGFTTTATAGTEVVGTLNSLGLKIGVPAYLTTAATGGGGGGEWTVLTTNAGTDILISTATNTNTLYHPKYITTYAAGGGEIAFSAGASSDDLASIVFSNSYNVSFGLNGSTVTASASYSNPGATVFSNSNNVTFGLNGSTITASVTVASSSEPRIISINGSSGSISFATGSSLSSSINGSSITWGLASNITTALQSAGNYLTTAAQVSHSHGNPTLSLSNLSGATASASDGLTISLTGHNAGYSNTTQFSTAFLTAQSAEPRVISLNGSSGSISLNVGSSLSASTDGSTIVFGLASNITSALQSAGAYLTTQSAHTQFVGQISTGITGGSWTINSSQLSINIPQGSLYFGDGSGVTFGVASVGLATTVTASINPAITTANYAGTGLSLGTTGGTELKATLNTTGLTISYPNFIGSSFTTTATNGTAVLGTLDTAGLRLAVPAYITTYTPGAGGGEWTVITTNAGTDIVISTASNTNTLYHPAFITTYAAGAGSVYSGDFISLSTVGGSTSVSVTNTSAFSTNAMHTSERGNYFYSSNNTFLTNQTVQPVAISASNGSYTFNTLTLGTKNGFTFYTDASGLQGSYTVPSVTTANYAGTGLSLDTTVGTEMNVTFNTTGLTISYPHVITTALGTGSTISSQAGTSMGLTANSDGINIAYPKPITTAVGTELSTATTSGSAILASFDTYGLKLHYPVQIGTSFVTAATAGTAVVGTLDTAGLKVGVPAFVTAAGGSVDWATETTNAGTAMSISTGAATNTLYYPKYITTYSPGAGVALAAVGSTASDSTVSLSNSNGVSFGVVVVLLLHR